jgi:hypothetical protein
MCERWGLVSKYLSRGFSKCMSMWTCVVKAKSHVHPIHPFHFPHPTPPYPPSHKPQVQHEQSLQLASLVGGGAAHVFCALKGSVVDGAALPARTSDFTRTGIAEPVEREKGRWLSTIVKSVYRPSCTYIWPSDVEWYQNSNGEKESTYLSANSQSPPNAT